MPKLQKTKNRYFITLPRSLIEKKKWEKGQDLYICFNERGNMEIQE